ncbi:MAG: hypothetical protein J6Y02_03840 [Pseudobutyrivibrio sp.]|nr:hypothetical protein [Pseudobutyrivibrio sp.]
MLQVDVCPYASDALEDAMRLAQTKSLNSYTFSDCLNFLNYVWSDIYNQICMIDSGYYSKTVKLTDKLTKLPRFVKNSVRVYSAQRPVGFDRRDYRQSGDADLTAPYTYQISGTDLWCPDALNKTVWLEYCPQPTQIFFTHHNRDPKIYPGGHDIEMNDKFNLYQLIGVIPTSAELSVEINITDKNITGNDIARCTKWLLRHRNPRLEIADEDITEYVIKESDPEEGDWQLKYISCDYPYIFCSYQNSITGEWHSGFLNKQYEWTNYNPFAFIGRKDNIEYLSCKYNDKTGMGVIVRDWNDIDEKITKINNIPEQINSVIYIENDFEYKCTDGTVINFTHGYWYNRFATDFNYEKVLEWDPEISPDIGDTVLDNAILKMYNGTNWEELNTKSIKHFGIKESNPVVKELGWTPDTKLVYPAPEVYRYLVARLAEKFAALNESNIMGVQSELTDAHFAFQAFLKKDKSAWERMRNVNPATITDWL